MNRNQIIGIVRHVLTFGGGYLVAKGKLDAVGAENIIGALVTLIGGIWSAVAPEKKVE